MHVTDPGEVARVVLVIVCFGVIALAQEDVLQDIVVSGQRRIPAETIKTRMFTKPGDVYDQAAIERDFNSLWNTGYFEDIRFEREEAAKGWILHVYVREKPTIREINYVGVNAVTQSEILDRYKERKVSLSPESPYNPTTTKKAEVVLKELLAARGRQFATVRTTVRPIPPASVALTFVVNEGPKVKVGRIRFEGNKQVSRRYSMQAMKNSRPIGIPHSIFLENIFARTFDASKLSEDAERVRYAYQNKGYAKAVVENPRPAIRDTGHTGWHIPVIQKGPGKAVDLTVSVEEGLRYRLKEIRFTNNKALSNPKALRMLFKIQDGDVWSAGAFQKGLQGLRKAYGQYGYINFTAVPSPEFDDANKMVTWTIDCDEDKPFFVRRIEFTGNTTTRDKVIRRELALEEGSVYNTELWKFSLLRLNQLQYFEPLDPDRNTDTKVNQQQGVVDLTLNVREKGKNSVGLMGGVSGLAGGFIGFNYATNNFLGLGETFSVAVQFGARQRTFQLGFTSPYTFDRALTTGFTLFNTQYRYDQQQEMSIAYNQQVSLNPASLQNYTQNSRGFTLFASRPLSRRSFARVGVTYTYSVTDIDATTNAAQVLFQTIQYRNFAGPSALRGVRSSKITPTISYNTVDNPMNPSHGKSFFYSVDVEGLGGNVKSIRQVFEAKYFKPVNHNRNVLAFRLQPSFTTGYGGVAVSPYDRFYTGGDDSIRGFDIRAVSPAALVPVANNVGISFADPNQLDSSGSPGMRSVGVPVLTYTIVSPGGDTQVIGNAEYRIPLAGPVSMAFFFDAGINGILRKSQLKLDSAGLAQLRTQFPNANISDTLQLAPGSNFAPRTSTGIQFVVQLPIIQAPLRLYWAFNPNRYTQTITAPASLFYLSDTYRNSLPPGVYSQQIVPKLTNVLADPQEVQFRERRSTFRFSISQTF